MQVNVSKRVAVEALLRRWEMSQRMRADRYIDTGRYYPPADDGGQELKKNLRGKLPTILTVLYCSYSGKLLGHGS